MTEEIDALFRDQDPTRRVRGALAPVVMVAGSKGGVGATTVAIVAAEMARVSGGVDRVVLVDADPRTSQVGSYLRARTTGAEAVPTILTGALHNDHRLSLAGPDVVNATHASGIPDISMKVVLAPPPAQYDPVAVTSGSYAEVLRLLRHSADLVIVNVGTLLPSAPTPLQESFVWPALRAGAWLLVVSNTSRPAVQGALDTARRLAESGVATAERTFTMINARRGAMTEASLEQLTERLGQFSTALGVVDYDERNIGDLMESGHIPASHPELVGVLAEALHVVTGRPNFAELASGRRRPGDRPDKPAKKRLSIPGLR